MSSRLLVSLASISFAALIASRPAAAVEGLYLAWDDCPLGASSADGGFDCLSSTGRSLLFCAFRMPQAADSVLALEFVVDLLTASPALPDWWQLGADGCRDGALRVDDVAGPSGACVNLWHGQAVGGLLSYTVGMPRGGANQARIRAALAVTSNAGLTLNATDLYYGARIVLAHSRTVNDTVNCAGCGVPVCLVLNSIRVRRPPRPEGAPSTDVLLEAPGPGDANRVTWQGGSGADCLAVPVRRTSWGALKSFYR